MKRSILFSAICFVALGAVAQTKKPAAAKPAAKPASKPVVNPMKNSVDSFSYALGVSLATFYKDKGITNINNQMLTKAMADCKAGKAQLNEGQVQSVIMSHINAIRKANPSPIKKAGDAFLAANKKRPGVITTASGLQYEIINEGTGEKPTVNDEVKVHYTGTLIDGKVFDSSVERGQPITFGVTNVIPGWTEALLLMPMGSKWKIYLPSELGYGDQGAGADIKPGSALIFEVTLLDVIKK